MQKSVKQPAASSCARFSVLESRAMTDVLVDVFYNSDDGLLKVTWSHGKCIPGGGGYHVSYPRIEERSKVARHALQDLVDAGRGKNYQTYDDLVRKLAAAGFRRYEALFFGDSQQDRNIATRARTWLEQNLRPGEDNITFRLPSRIHFPWGLIYDQPVTRDTAPREFRKHFWCNKYSATVHYFSNKPEFEEKPWPQPPFGVLFGADEEVWSAAHENLEAQERRRLFGLLGHPAQPMFKVEDLSRYWRDHREDIPHSLLTFYCHAAGDELSIGGATLSSNDFEEVFVRSEESPP